MRGIVIWPALLLLATACAPEPVATDSWESPIINGEACDATQLPQTVALLVDATVNFGGGPTQVRTLMCTGTVIAPDVVLTAAHCIEPALLGNPERLDYYISFEADLSAYTDQETVIPLPTDAILVRTVVKHEQFDIFGESPGVGLANFFDIGLVFLDTPIPDLVPAIVMTPEESEVLAVGDEVQIAGWGRRTVEDSDEVGERYCATANIFEVGDFELRIGKEASTARKCHGDSGGPTYITIASDHTRKDRVIGITSRAYNSEVDCGEGGIDTMSSAWYQWIDDTMGGLCASEQRAWCDVPGIVPPEFYDDDGKTEEGEEDGGCNAAGGNTTGFFFLLLLMGLVGLRRKQSA